MFAGEANMRWLQRRSKDRSVGERGQTLVEFALILPLLVLILMGVFDFGRAFYAYNNISGGAREGARYGVIHPTETAAIEGRVEAHAVALDPTELTINVDPAGGQRGDPLTVTVTYDFYAITPLIGQIIGNPMTLRSSATMIIEQPPGG